MQWVLFVGAVILSLAVTLGSASAVLSLFFHIMQKLR